MYIPLSSVSHPFLINLGSFFTSVIGIVDTISFFATIDFFSGTTGVVFNADSVVALGFALLTGGFVAFGFAFGTIDGFVGAFGVATAGLIYPHWLLS